ncbi:MAG: HlyD family efflux transporter periplasmic adaptor subunit [Bacteroidales bacterium]|nr:HlyD family efflux transporter periplasmic adaptor subunit [Bacteroidales bacterium]
MKRFIRVIVPSIFVLISCTGNNKTSDAYGNFEAIEVLVSSQAQGELTNFTITEGSDIKQGEHVGSVDTVDLSLKKEQLLAQIKVVYAKSRNVLSQIDVQEKQKQILQKEKNRILNLLKDQAATEQQMDDILGKIDLAAAQITSIKTQNASILGEIQVLQVQVAQINEQISKCRITNPVNGTVLEKFVEAGELVMPGKALYKVANLENMELKVFVSGAQLPKIKIGGEVDVIIDKNEKENQVLSGRISWISSEFEFTPKIIQTKEERVNMVYPVKVNVKNDGTIKIGMPGEIRFRN